jgi:glycerol-3-phosphate dehydrogenase
MGDGWVRTGTSSRSTKLIHGGVRYLEKAFWSLDRGQYELVREALRYARLRSCFCFLLPATVHPILI